jgi:FK506-binding protein 2
MLVLKWLSVLALTALAASADTDVPELVIDRTYIPTDCPVKSQKGDKIRVHYVSRDRRPL